MNVEDRATAALLALAGLNNRVNTEPNAVEETGDEVSARNTAGTASNDAVEKKSQRGRRRTEYHKFPVEPRTIQVIKKPRTHMNHSYRDFSSVPTEMNYEVPEKISDMTFPQKVHHMLCQEEYKKWIGWLPHGRAFRILVPKLLEKSQLLQKYFGHGRYSSFLRQLSNHGFKHISSGPDRNTYYHEFILCGLPHLTKYMPEPKDSRRLIPDPDNEPNFYAISSEYPLPDDPDFYMVEPVEDSEEPKKRAANAPVAAPRLASEASWFNNEMPPAKRPAFERNTDAAASRFNTVPASALSRLQDAITSPPELSWFNGRMPPGLMYDTEAVGGLMASSEAVSHVPLVPPITSSLAQLQDAINMNRNNQLMAVALRAQHLGSLPQQQVPELGSNPLMAEIVAAMLRSRGL